MMNRNLKFYNAAWRTAALLFTLALLCSCTPRVELEAPDKPITINLNVKIEHEVRVKIDKQLEDEVFNKDKKLF